MEPGNGTQISEFLLLGLSQALELQPLIFGLFLSMYLVTVLGNLLIILAVSSDSHLHTPMYFFLSNLSLVDICFTSTTIPKMLWNIQTQSKVITYEGCITQMYFYTLFAVLDNFILTVMAYDRFVAICHPLHYMVIMNPQLCGLLVLLSWILSAMVSLLHSLMVLRLSFCSDLEIPHFFCELNQILYSYSKILSSICGIPSAQGKYKAFSTCASHLSVVSLFYGRNLGVYLSSTAAHSAQLSATTSVMYTVVTPMLNPFIYSLRNNDIKRALQRFFGSHLQHMEPGNGTQISEFLLLGLSQTLELQPLIFGLFLSMYLVTVLGNLLIILAVSSDSHLHTPMYFFLSNLSLVDICFTSTTIPKMLWNIQTQSKVITYQGCITQMYFYILFAMLDNMILTVMAYDRFVAICHPLHYMVIMNPQLCGLLVLVSWIMSVLNSLLNSLMVLGLRFCSDLKIPHFFCELSQVVHIACSDTFLNNIIMYFSAGLLGGGPFAGILYSYSKILSSICGIPSAQGKYKAFSTCASHLSVVSLFYSTSLGVYLSFTATQNAHSSATASVMYTVVTPMLNPFIYSLRNNDIKRALQRFLGR
ncbi:Olfactory receptor 7A17 [Myotis brandtii]|uniref:Olfactory receptor 7A17 n=2 Tax=Myotis brandtii TaxID=109478 RepID=S7Q5C9_MYOBR|nr:Olfactory receptor 7A17 [Myotis brandtii]